MSASEESSGEKEKDRKKAAVKSKGKPNKDRKKKDDDGENEPLPHKKKDEDSDDDGDDFPPDGKTRGTSKRPAAAQSSLKRPAAKRRRGKTDDAEEVWGVSFQFFQVENAMNSPSLIFYCLFIIQWFAAWAGST